MDRRNLAVEVADYIDEHHPRLGSQLLQLRWGGFRTVRPGRSLATGAVAAGAALGLGGRRILGRRPDGRHRVGVPTSASLGVLGLWLMLWRLDSLRWRRSHVTMVLDLPSGDLDLLVAHLRSVGAQVERHDRRRGAGGGASGLTCRLRDLRRVNAEIDAFDPRPTAAPQDPEGAGHGARTGKA